jgi:hypothetical protein
MKRTIRKNIYGNWVGYVGRNKVEQFCDNESLARYWLATGRAELRAPITTPERNVKWSDHTN